MKSTSYAITTDWEVMSPSVDGMIEIDIDNHMIKPAMKLAEIAERYEIKISFMLEVIEVFRFLDSNHLRDEGLAILEIVNFLGERGHDIQLHGHSEWITAEYIRGGWFRQFEGPDNIHEKMTQFFIIFDSMIGTLRDHLPPNWEPKVFRAGAYNINPTKELFSQLRKRGIIADTSMHSAEMKKAWPYKIDGLVELPICGSSGGGRRWDMNRDLTQVMFHKNFLEDSHPRIMIGHTKMEHNWGNIGKMFRNLAQTDGWESKTISEIAKEHADG